MQNSVIVLAPSFPGSMTIALKFTRSRLKSSSWFFRGLLVLQFGAGLLQQANAQTGEIFSSTVETARYPAPGKATDQSDLFDLNRLTSPGSSSHYYLTREPRSEPFYIFFPPILPALEGEIPVLPRFGSGIVAPSELSLFVGELFYPLLGARLASDDLNKAIAAQLRAYRELKLTLQRDLRQHLAAQKNILPEKRAQELTAFATLQAPSLLELNSMAEKIHADLRRSDSPGLHLADDVPSNADPAGVRAEAIAMRNAAFYEEGFSTAQRHLLLEAATELEVVSSPPTTPNASGSWLLSLSPEPASVRLADDLPAATAKKISEYLAAKKILKVQLRGVLATGKTSGKNVRAASVKALAAEQSSSFATLEIAAEEVRLALAALPNLPGPPTAPALPAELAERITNYRIHKIELLKTLYTLVAGSVRNDRGISSNGGSSKLLSWVSDGKSQTEAPPSKLRVSPGTFDKTQSQLLEELNREQAAIREAMAEYFRTTQQPADRKSINDLLQDFETARQKQEVWEKYRDYQTAVLMPGLSAGQRRLLFDAAVENLSLPLPAGEKIP